MKKADVIVGEVYTAKVGGKIVNVRILSRTDGSYPGMRSRATTHWQARNLATGREIRIRSAARLRTHVPAKQYVIVVDHEPHERFLTRTGVWTHELSLAARWMPDNVDAEVERQRHLVGSTVRKNEVIR